MACKYTYKGITYNSKEEFINQVVNPQILGKPDVILPIGTSGSGKSTFIKSLPQENLIVIEPDAMRVEFTGDINDKSKDKEIYEEAAKRAIIAIKKGKQVVFDTTNLTKDKRLPFIEAIKKEIPNANIQYKLMELNPELAKQRIKAQIARGENRANVPDSTIDRHAESYKQMIKDIKNEPITPFLNKTPTKTRRILEVQSDLFQKGRDKTQLDKTDEGFDIDNIGNRFEQFTIDGVKYVGLNGHYSLEDSNDPFENVEKTITKEEFLNKFKEYRKSNPIDNTKNQFLQLLNKNNNWVTFFVKSIIQDSAKKGYEKILFPSGNTASKVEGHTTLEEFKKQKEDRIKELETASILKNKTVDGFYYIQRYLEDEAGNEVLTWRKVSNETGKEKTATIEEINQLKERFSDETKNEINQLKQELERVETEGFGALKPIYNFYENTVTNILKKNGYSPVLITDEYGNTWNEVNLDNANLLPFALKNLNSFTQEDLVNIDESQFNNWLKDNLPDFIKVKYGDLADDLFGRLDQRGITFGEFRENTIFLNSKIPLGTEYHEAFHAVFRTFMDNVDINRFFSYVKSKRGVPSNQEINDFRSKTSRYDGLTNRQIEELIYEEWLADKFQDWKNNKNTPIPNPIKALYQKIVDFFKWLSKSGDELEQLFRKINTGKFKNGTVRPNKFNLLGRAEAFKIIAGKGPVASQEVIGTITAMILENTNLTINQAIDNQIELRRFTNKLNLDRLRDLTPERRVEFKRFLDREVSIYSNEDNRLIIKEQVEKLLKSLGYNIVEEEYKAFEAKDEGDYNWERNILEEGGFDGLSKPMKELLATTLIEDFDEWGLPSRRVINWQQVYVQLSMNLAKTSEGNMMPKLLRLGELNPHIKAFANRLVNLTGWSEETPNGDPNSLQAQMWLRKFYKAFENGVYPQITTLINQGTGELKSVSSNQEDLDDFIVSEWVTNYNNYGANRLSQPDQKKRILDSLNTIISDYNQGLEVSRRLQEVFSDIGIKLDVNYLRQSLGETKDYSSLLEEGDEIVTLREIQLLRDEIRDNINPFSQQGMISRLYPIAKTNLKFSGELPFTSSYQDSEGKQRYTVAPTMQISERVDFIKAFYSLDENIDALRNDPYWRYNGLLLDRTNEQVKEYLHNLQLTVTGDLRDEESGKDGRNYKSIDDIALLSDWISNFLDVKNINQIPYSRITAFIPSTKNILFSYRVPVNSSLYNVKSGGISDKTIDDIYNTIFIQEYNRVVKNAYKQPFKNKGFINLPFFNNFNFGESLNEGEVKAFLRSNLETGIQDWLKVLQEFKLDQVVQRKAEGTYKGETPEQTMKNLAGNMYLNYLINDTQINQLVQGDLALAKDDIDRVKRNSMHNNAGITRTGRRIGTIYTEDDTQDSEQIEQAKKIDVDDGQIYSSIKDLIATMYDFGRLTQPMLDILTRLDNPPIKKGVPQFPTDKEIKDSGVDLLAWKPVTSGVDEQGNQIYHKASIAFLSKRLVAYYDQGWKPLPGKELLFEKLNTLDEKYSSDWDYKTGDVVQLVPKSASKMFTGKTDGSVYYFDGKAQRLQVETGTKSKLEITSGVQAIQLIDNELPNSIEANDLRKEFNDTLSQISKQSLQYSLNYLIKENGDKADITKFLEKARDLVEASNPNPRLFEFLQDNLKGDLKYDFNLLPVLTKMESIYWAHYNNSLRFTSFGDQKTLLSASGYKVLADDIRVISNDEFIKSPESFKDEKIYQVRDLKIHKFQNNKLDYAEVVVTKRQASLLGLTIGEIYSFNPEILKGFGFRIPTQDYHSMLPFKIVDFLPEEYGSTIIAPKEMVWLAGWDFDLDKLFTYLRATYRDAEGNLKSFGDYTTDEEKWYEYKLDQFKRNKDLKDFNQRDLKDIKDEKVVELINKIDLNDVFLPGTLEEYVRAGLPDSPSQLDNKLLSIYLKMLEFPELKQAYRSPATLTDIKTLADEVSSLRGDNKRTYLYNAPDGMYASWKNGSVGKKNIGVAATNNLVNSVLTKNNISLNPGFELKFNGNTYDTFSSTAEEKRAKQHNSSSVITSATDNEKTPTHSILNWTFSTLGAYLSMMNLKIPMRTISLFSNQPILVEYAKRLEAYNSAVVIRGFNDKSAFAIQQEFLKAFVNNKADQVENLELTDEELQGSIGSKELYTPTQFKVFKQFLTANSISSASIKVGMLIATNKSLGGTFSGADNTQRAMRDLGLDPKNSLSKGEREALPFNIQSVLDNNSNLRTNLENLSKIQEASKHFFLYRTPLYIKFFDKVSQSLNKFIRRQDLEKTKQDILTYLTLRVYEKKLGIKFDDLNYIVYNGLIEGKTTLLSDYQTLSKKYEEFRTNKFVEFLEAKPSDGQTNRLDLLTANARIKIQPSTLEILLDSFSTLRRSDNKEIVDWTKKAIAYLLVKDNFFSKTDSFINYVFPEEFLKLAESSRELNKLLAEGGNIKTLTDKSYEEHLSEFQELFFRHPVNKRKIYSVGNLGPKATSLNTSDGIKVYEFKGLEDGFKISLLTTDIGDNTLFNTKGSGKTFQVIYPDFISRRVPQETLFGDTYLATLVYKKIGDDSRSALYQQVSSVGQFTGQQAYLHNTPEKFQELNTKVSQLKGTTVSINQKDKPLDAENKGIVGSVESPFEDDGYDESVLSKASTNTVSVETIIPVLEDLKKRFNVDYEIVNEPDVVWAGQFRDHKVIINSAKVEEDTPFHEFAHPFIRIVRKMNRPVYDSLIKELSTSTEGKAALKHVKEYYPELDANDQKEEAIVHLIGAFSAYKAQQPKGIWMRIKQFLQAIINYFKAPVDPVSLTNMSIKDLAEIVFKDTIDVSKAEGMFKGPVSFSKVKEKKEETPFKKQQVFFNSRVRALEKRLKLHEEGTKEYNKVRDELNELKDKFGRAVDNNSFELYKELGESILDDLEGFISRAEETGIDQDKEADYIEYSDQVLDTWREFPELETRVRALERRLYPFIEKFTLEEINKYATEKEPITQEAVDKQDKDIGSFTKGVGSLSDLANYIGRTIGSIIKAAQTRIASINKESNHILKEEVDSLQKYADSKGIKLEEVYNSLIEEKGSTTQLKEFDDSWDEEVKKFYRFYQRVLIVSESKLPLSVGRFFIPNISKQDLLSSIKALNPIKERNINEDAKDEELFADVVPLRYIKSMLPSEKTNDLGAALLLFMNHANQYGEMDSILPKVRVLQKQLVFKRNSKNEIVDRTFTKSSNPNIAIKGEDSNIYKMVSDVIDMQVKGKMKKDEGKIKVSPIYDSEGNETGEKYFDVTELLDNALRYNSLLRIGLSPLTALTNVIFGDASNIIEAIGGRYFNLKELHQATNIFFKKAFDENSNLYKWLEKLNPLQELDDYDYLNQVSLTKGISKEKAFEKMYWMQKKGELFLQSRTMLAILIREGYMTSTGETTAKGEKATERELETITDKIQRLNHLIHGRYTQKEAATLQQSVFYRLASQFRKWIPSALESRFADYHYDNRLQTDIEGRWKTFYRLIRNLKDTQERLSKGELTDLEIYNMRKMLVEITLLITTTLLGFILFGGDDEKRKKRLSNPINKTLLTLLNRVSGDINLWYNPAAINNLAGNIVPLTKTTGDLIKAVQYLPDAFYLGDYKYKTGSRKGDNRFFSQTRRLIPGFRSIEDIRRMTNKFPLEELR